MEHGPVGSMQAPRDPDGYEVWRDGGVTIYVEPAAIAGWRRAGALVFSFGMFGSCTLRLDRGSNGEVNT